MKYFKGCIFVLIILVLTLPLSYSIDVSETFLTTNYSIYGCSMGGTTGKAYINRTTFDNCGESNIFNGELKWVAGQQDDENVLFTNSSDNFNTEIGSKMTILNTALDNKFFSFGTYFNNEYYILRNKSIVSFYCGGANAEFPSYIVFGNDTSSMIALSVHGSCGVSHETENCCSTFFSGIGKTCVGEFHNINFTGEELFENCNMELNHLTFNSFQITGLHLANTGDVIDYDDFNFYNLSNGSNELPFYNITYNDTALCINQSGDTIDFNFTIDSYDNEGNEIYYAVNQFNSFRRKLSMYEDFMKINSEGECISDYGFFTNTGEFTNGFYYSNYSYGYNIYDTSFSVIGAYFGLEPDRHHIMPFNIENEICNYGLLTFDEVKKFGIGFETIYDYDSLTELQFTTIDLQSSFNFVFIDSINHNILNLSFNYTDNNTLYFGIDGFNNLSVAHNINDRIVLYVEMYKSNDTIYIRLDDDFNQTTAIHEFLYDKSFNNYGGIVFYTNDEIPNTLLSKSPKAWLLNKMVMEGVNFEIVPDWSINKPTGYSFKTIGNKVLDIYISDDVNSIINNYKTETISLYVQDCRDLIKEGVGWTEDEEVISFFEGFKSIFMGMCTSFDNSNIGRNGTSDSLKKISWCTMFILFYGLFALVIGIVFFVIARYSLIWGLEAFSFVMMWGTLLLEYSIFLKILIGVMFSFCTGILVLTMFRDKSGVS